MTDEQAIQKIWDYHLMRHELKKADLIMVLGSHDPRVAKYGAELYLWGWAPRMIFTGTGFGHKEDLLATDFHGRTESEYFADIAKKIGVPGSVILIENKSRNTGQNFEFTGKLLEEKGIKITTVIVVQKPYMERRAYATGKKWWPNIDLIIASPPLSFEDYTASDIPKDDVINIMVGDLQRIKEYPKKGFQIEQNIPSEVWEAFEQLVKAGYTEHLIKE